MGHSVGSNGTRHQLNSQGRELAEKEDATVRANMFLSSASGPLIEWQQQGWVNRLNALWSACRQVVSG